MNNKGQGPIVNFIALAVLLLIIIFLIFALSQNVGYSIRINESEIPKGIDIYLSYTIENSLLFEDINNVQFNYSISNEYGLNQIQDSVPIGPMGARTERSDNILLETSDLSRGEYTIWTNIHYWRGGKLEAKYFSLKLIIY